MSSFDNERIAKTPGSNAPPGFDGSDRDRSFHAVVVPIAAENAGHGQSE